MLPINTTTSPLYYVRGGDISLYAGSLKYAVTTISTGRLLLILILAAHTVQSPVASTTSLQTPTVDFMVSRYAAGMSI